MKTNDCFDRFPLAPKQLSIAQTSSKILTVNITNKRRQFYQRLHSQTQDEDMQTALVYTGSISGGIDRLARRSDTPGDHTSSIIQLPTSTAKLVCYILSVLLFLFYGSRKSSVLVVQRVVRTFAGMLIKMYFVFRISTALLLQ